jgi:hypothetical protein
MGHPEDRIVSIKRMFLGMEAAPAVLIAEERIYAVKQRRDQDPWSPP